MSKVLTFLIVFYSLSADLIGEVQLVGSFSSFETYYIGMIDLETGTTNVPLFNFTVQDPNLPTPYNPLIEFHAQFKFEIHSPELGFNERTTLLNIQTEETIKMAYPIQLDNTQFNLTNTAILDQSGGIVELVLSDPVILENIDTYENMLSSIVNMGRLPDGLYYITLRLFDDSGVNIVNPQEHVINITTPTSLNLLYPGGALADTTQNIVYTPYPVFQWSTETCTSCELFIRVAEFNSEMHSSPEEAIEDVTSLPIDQIEGWGMVDGGTSFQYPVIGAGELQAGKLYVWQIKKELPTTLGTDAYLSPISVFKIADLSTGDQEVTTDTDFLSDPILIALKDFLGEETFNVYFGSDGEFANFLPSGTYRINNENTTSNDILQILDQLQQGTISVVNINVE